MALDLPSYLLGKSKGGGGGTSDYSQLTNKPSINGVTLSGNKTSEDLELIEGNCEIVTLKLYSGSMYSQEIKQAELDKASKYITELYEEFVNRENGVKPKVLFAYSIYLGEYSGGNAFFKTSVTSQKNSYRFINEYAEAFGETDNVNSINSINFQGTWNNDKFTCTSFSLNNWNKRQFLAANNSASYTPTQQYHPATKGYVDSAIASAITDALGGNY